MYTLYIPLYINVCICIHIYIYIIYTIIYVYMFVSVYIYIHMSINKINNKCPCGKPFFSVTTLRIIRSSGN